MNPSPVDELPLIELFTRLREAGLPLGINEYQLALQSLQAGFGIQDRESLAKLCRTLWIKSPEENRLFNHHFEQSIGSLTSFDSGSSYLYKKDQTSSQSKFWLLDSNRLRRFIRLITVVLVISGAAAFFFSISRNQPSQPKTSSESSSTTVPIPNPSLSLPSPRASSESKVTPLPTTATDVGFQNKIELVFGIAFVSLFGVLVIGSLWVMWLTRQRDRQTPSTAKTAVSRTNKLSTELIQQIGDEVRVARVVRRRLGGDIDVDDRVLTNPEFFPITRRQMKQSWRYLRCFIREGAPTEIDIDATIRHVGQQGLLLEPVLVPGRINRTELLLLIDQDGSMVPFHSLSQRLIETAVQGGRLGSASVYYFHNCPTDYVYHDPMHQSAVAIEDFFMQLNPRTAVLIFSDAGSARGSFNPRRRRAAKTFIDDLKQHVRHIAWLNPMPRSRWDGTTAGEIANVIPMFEMSRRGLDGAIDVLRGRHR